MHKNVAVKTDEKKRWRIEVLNKVTRHIRLDFHDQTSFTKLYFTESVSNSLKFNIGIFIFYL